MTTRTNPRGSRAPTPTPLDLPETEDPEVAVQREPPAQEEIARRAYELYLERGGQDGHDVEDWMRAEAELVPGRG
jgi:Protein of unknown function (DUF2934)